MLRGIGRKLPVVGVVVALALTSACGGGGGDSSLTRDEFVKQAEAVCRKAAAKKNKQLVSALKKDPKAFNDPQAREGLEEELATEVVLPQLTYVAREMRRLAGLSDEDAVGTVASAYEHAVRKVTAEPSSALGGNSPITEADKLADTDYQLKSCSNF